MNNPRKSVIIANGDFVFNDRIRKQIESADRIVCADGGANNLVDIDITPDLILGDSDSILSDTLRHFKDVEVIKESDENGTDIMKVINYELSRGVDELVLLGATGGRIDHTLANLSLLTRYTDLIKINIIDNNSEILFIKDSISFESQIGRKLSLMVIGGNSSLTTKGLKWELNEESLLFSPFGISNEVAFSPVTIEVEGNGVFLFKLFEMSDGTPLIE